MIKLFFPHGDDDLGGFFFSLGFATQLGDSPRACGSELGPNDLPWKKAAMRWISMNSGGEP